MDPERYASYAKTAKSNRRVSGKHAAYMRHWRSKNVERRKTYKRGYRRTHVYEARIQAKNRKHALRMQTFPKGWRFTKLTWCLLLDCFDYKCVYGKQPITLDTATRDHDMPGSRGGLNTLANILPACRDCNSRKHNKTAEEFMATLGPNYACNNNDRICRPRVPHARLAAPQVQDAGAPA